MRRLLWAVGVLLTAALLVGVVVASLDGQRRNGPIPVDHGDPGDPANWPLRTE